MRLLDQASKVPPPGSEPRQVACGIGPYPTRNLLGVVQAVTEHTARKTPPAIPADTLAERFSGSIASHYLLAARGWEDVPIDRLARSRLAHLADLFGTRIAIEGPDLLLRPQAAQIIGMAIHELATSSCKHGGLGTRTGLVRLVWSRTGPDRGGRLEMRWEEVGGPACVPYGRRGLGSKVVLDMVACQLGADVTLEGRPDGLLWRLAAPAEHIIQELPASNGTAVAPLRDLARHVAQNDDLQSSIIQNDDYM